MINDIAGWLPVLLLWVERYQILNLIVHLCNLNNNSFRYRKLIFSECICAVKEKKSQLKLFQFCVLCLSVHSSSGCWISSPPLNFFWTSDGSFFHVFILHQHNDIFFVVAVTEKRKLFSLFLIFCFLLRIWVVCWPCASVWASVSIITSVHSWKVKRKK